MQHTKSLPEPKIRTLQWVLLVKGCFTNFRFCNPTMASQGRAQQPGEPHAALTPWHPSIKHPRRIPVLQPVPLRGGHPRIVYRTRAINSTRSWYRVSASQPRTCQRPRPATVWRFKKPSDSQRREVLERISFERAVGGNRCRARIFVSTVVFSMAHPTCAWC